MRFHFVMFLVVIFVAFSMHAMANAAPLRPHAVAGAAADSATPGAGTRPGQAPTR